MASDAALNAQHLLGVFACSPSLRAFTLPVADSVEEWRISPELAFSKQFSLFTYDEIRIGTKCFFCDLVHWPAGAGAASDIHSLFVLFTSELKT